MTTKPPRGAKHDGAHLTKYDRLVYDMVARGLIAPAYVRDYARELRNLTDGGYVELDARGQPRVTRRELPPREPPPEPMDGVTARVPASIKARLVALGKADFKGNKSAALIAVLDEHLPPLDDGEGATDGNAIAKRPSHSRRRR